MKTARAKQLTLTILLIFSLHSYAQDKSSVNFGKVSINDFSLNSPLIDTNSSAVIVADYGDTKFVGNDKGWFTYVFKRKKRIKIIDKKAFDLATVKILLYRSDEGAEKLENISAAAYNVEEGKLIETKLTSKEVYDEKVDRNYSYKKFSVPGVKEGSIIEYAYTVKSDFIFRLPAWEFQSDKCPTLWSEYNIVLPSLLNYMTFPQGYHSFFINTGSEGHDTYLISRPRENGGYASEGEKLSVSSSTIIHRWVMKDIPAFHVESYISSSSNFVDKISFQLSRTYDGEKYHEVANTWTKTTEDLMKQEDFGLPLTESNEWLDKILNSIVTPGEDQLQATKKIYYYIQNNYTCTNHYDKYIKTTLQDVVKKKSGTVGDLNLLLTALLLRKNISASPVLLSTTDYGRNQPNYPLMEQLNYTICLAKIQTTDYYLDATQPYLAFGKLPLECYNGHARVISKDTAAVYFLTDSIREKTLVNVVVINNDKKQTEGSYECKMGFYESLTAKNKIAGNGVDNFKTTYKNRFPEDLLVDSVRVDSFTVPEALVSVKFDFGIKSFENADIVYLNPLMGEALQKNPFFVSERIYPVEMPYGSEKTFVFYMDIPEGYQVDELPKSTLVKLNDNDGFFEYLINTDGKSIQMRRRLVMYQVNFTSEDYQTLRDFYTHIVKKESEQIVFKKKK